MDKFTISSQADGDVLLSFTKEKSYPAQDEDPPLPAESPRDLRIAPPSVQQAKLASLLIVNKYPAHQYPAALRHSRQAGGHAGQRRIRGGGGL